MASQKVKIFFTGATGYVGVTVVSRLLDHPQAESVEITALVRSKEKGSVLEKFGVKAVVGSLDESEKVEELASGADVVFSLADSDDVASTKAVLRGMKKRFEVGGNAPILIHTSGAGIVADYYARGKMTDSVIHSDLDIDHIESIPIEPFNHREVDIEIVKADAEGYVRSYIIVPGSIYGLPSGKIVENGIQHRHSMQMPFFIRNALERGHVGIAESGENVWPFVHVSDLAELYMVLYDSATLRPASTAHGREGFYFGENGECKISDVLRATASVLFELGKVNGPHPTPFSPEEYKKDPMLALIFGSNCRARGDRARALGWKPVKQVEEVFSSVKPEIEVILSGVGGVNVALKMPAN